MTTEARLELTAGDRLEYRFCSPGWREALRTLPVEELLDRAAAIDESRCRRLTLSGAPLSHPGFDAIVETCRQAGLPKPMVETDGKDLAVPGRIEHLAELGIDTLFVVVGGMRRPVYERVMRDDGFVDAFRAVADAAARGLRVYVVAPILAWTERDLEPLVDYLIAMDPRPTGFLPWPPEVADVPPEYRKLLLSHRRQAAIAKRLFELCSRHRLEHGFFGKRGLLPCATDNQLDAFGTVFFERLSRLGPNDRDHSTRVDACGDCSLVQSCSGVDEAYLEHFGTAELQPVPLEVSMDWKLRPIHHLDEHGIRSVSSYDNDVENNGRSLVRVNGHCNMSCSFCYIDRTVADFDRAGLERAIDGLASQSLDHLVLSGGEPTLHPDLPELIAFAKARGFRTIEIQSNGVRSADVAYASRLVEAGLNKVTVSLHSADREHSDRITRLPGGFDKTLRAISNYRALGISTQVAHVITKSNFQELPKTVRFLREAFPADGGALSICFGIAQPISNLVYTWVMPKFSEVEPYMREALDYCLQVDLGFGGMIGQGGYPPCMLGGDLRYYEKNLGHIYRSEDHGEQFYKAKRCAECSFDPWCLGVRRYYVDTYGDAEIAPFGADVEGLGVTPLAERPPMPKAPEQLVTLRRRPS